MMKKLTAALVVLLFLAAMCVPALAVVDQSDDYYVADYANVLTQTTKDNIIWANSDPDGLEILCDGAQVVVVTVDYLEGMGSDEYAAKLFNDWGVGSEDKNNGMLLLLVPGENRGWLEVGRGLRGYWTESRIENLLNNYFWDYVDAGEYDRAVNNVMDRLFTWFADDYGLFQENQNYEQDYNQDYYQDHELEYDNRPTHAVPLSTSRAIFTTVFVAGIVVIILIFVLASAAGDRVRYRTYYSSMGIPMPRYHFWYSFGSHRPHRVWWHANRHQAQYRTSSRPSGRPPQSSGSRPSQQSQNRNKSSTGYGGFGSNRGNSGSSGNRSSGSSSSGFGGFGGSRGGGGSSGGGGSRGGGGGGGGGGRSGGGGGRR